MELQIATTLEEYLIRNVTDVCMSYVDWDGLCRDCGCSIPVLLIRCLIHQDWASHTLVTFAMCSNFAIARNMIAFEDLRDAELFTFLKNNIGIETSKPHKVPNDFKSHKCEIQLHLDKQVINMRLIKHYNSTQFGSILFNQRFKLQDGVGGIRHVPKPSKGSVQFTKDEQGKYTCEFVRNT